MIIPSISRILVGIIKQSREGMLKLREILRNEEKKKGGIDSNGWSYSQNEGESTANSKHIWVIKEMVWISGVGRAIPKSAYFFWCGQGHS